MNVGQPFSDADWGIRLVNSAVVSLTVVRPTFPARANFQRAHY